MASKDVQRLIGALQVVGGAVEAFYGGGSGGGYLIGSGVENLSGSKKGSAHVLTGRNFLGDVEGMATGSGPSQGGRIGGTIGGLAGGYSGMGSGGGSSWGGWSLGAGNKSVPFTQSGADTGAAAAGGGGSSSLLSALSGLMNMGGSSGGTTGGTAGGSAGGLNLGSILDAFNSANQQQQTAPQAPPALTIDTIPKALLPPAHDPLQLAIAQLLAKRIG